MKGAKNETVGKGTSEKEILSSLEGFVSKFVSKVQPTDLSSVPRERHT